jgi:hypothetical protein
MTLPVLTAPGVWPLTVYAGSAASWPLVLTDSAGAPLDLQDASAGTLRIHSGWGDAATVLAEGAVTITDAAAGELTMAITTAQTDAIAAAASDRTCDRTAPAGFYELELTDGTSTVRVLEGTVTASRRGA